MRRTSRMMVLWIGLFAMASMTAYDPSGTWQPPGSDAGAQYVPRTFCDDADVARRASRARELWFIVVIGDKSRWQIS